jgi:hopene-associated glycosyltransferase HpnB
VDVLVMILAVAAGLSLAAWIYLARFHGGFWSTGERLGGRGLLRPEDPPPVVIVVPARDEADILAGSLPTLLAQDYPGPARVILVDDNSTDGTGDLARSLGAAPDARLPLTVTTPGPPPPGWTGKLWALRHGVETAEADAGHDGPEYFLFTDADIAHAPDSLTRLVTEADARVDYDVIGTGPPARLMARTYPGPFALVSVMARLRVDTRWERVVVPAFVYFFAKLFPFRRVNDPRRRTAAAAGGCVLVRRDALARAGGIEEIRAAVIDDVSLGTAVKRSGGRVRLVLADPPGRDGGPVNVTSIRPYPRLADLWRMVSRSAFAQLRHSWLLLAGTVVGLALIYLAAPVALLVGAITGNVVLMVLGGLSWALMTATYIPMVVYYGRPFHEALLLPFAATLYLGMTVDSAIRHARGRGAAWKGRTYPAPGETPEPDRIA